MSKPIDSREIVRHELIGLPVEVVDDSNPCNKGIKGVVLDETMKTLVIRGNGDRRVAKKDAVFKFDLGEESVLVEGYAIMGRPEDRVKKNRKRW